MIAPPSGHIAGVWARTDGSRGVHKAPANETVRGAVDLTYSLTPAEQGLLNSAGVNAIRYDGRQHQGVGRAHARGQLERVAVPPGAPVLRVRRGVDPAGDGWVVFEPNDITLWNAISRDVAPVPAAAVA